MDERADALDRAVLAFDDELVAAGLAYRVEVPVWWCEELKTVLANEEVINGRSECGNFPCVRRPLEQWILKITAYAERLLADLDGLDWPESIKAMQREWIGRSEGAEIDFGIAGHETERFTVFTTRPDTLFGATFCVLAPEHPLVAKVTTEGDRAAVEAYVAAAASKSDLESEKPKTILLTSFSKPGIMFEADKSSILYSLAMPSPRGKFLTAFDNYEEPDSIKLHKGGSLFSWKDLNEIYNQLNPSMAK